MNTSETSRSSIPGAAITATAVVLFLLIFGELRGLMSRPLWLDEVHTALLASEPDWRRAWAALQCTDVHPPLHYVLAKAALSAGMSPERALRAVSVLSFGVLGFSLTLLLREHGAFSGAIAVFTVLSAPVNAESSLDGRPYALMLALSGLLAVCGVACWRQRTGVPVTPRIGLAAVAALLCSSHYYGILAWGLVLVGIGLLAWPDWRGFIRRCWTAFAGPVATLVWLPLLLHQRAALPVSTWMERALPSQSGAVVRDVTPALALAWLACLAVVVGVFTRRGIGLPSRQALLPVLPLAAIPVVLAAISLALQPTMLPRYAVVTSLAFAPIAAGIVGALPRGWRAIACLGVIAAAASSLVVFGNRTRDSLTHEVERIELATADPRTVAVFERRHDLFPILQRTPSNAGRMFFLDRSPEVLLRSTNFVRIESAMAANTRKALGWPKILVDEHLALPTVLLVAENNDIQRLAKRLPKYRLTFLSDRLFLAERARLADDPAAPTSARP